MSLVSTVLDVRLQRMAPSPLREACREVVRRALWIEGRLDDPTSKGRPAMHRELRALIYIARLVTSDPSKTLGEIIAEEEAFDP